MGDTFDYVIAGGGTCGPVIACRLSEDPNVKILVLEAGQDSANMDNMHMAGAYVLFLLNEVHSPLINYNK